MNGDRNNNSDTLSIGMEKATKPDSTNEWSLIGYVGATKELNYPEILPDSSQKIAKGKMGEKIEEVFDKADVLLETEDNLIMRDNLLDSLDALMDDLWEMRHIREREFAKYIVLVQTVTKGHNLEISNDEQIKALVTILHTMKRPKIFESDIRYCRKTIADVGIDIYKPLTTVSKYKITIEEK